MNKHLLASISFFFLIAFFGLTVFAWAHTNVTVTDAKQMIDTNSELVVIDVRAYTSEYCANGHIPGALNYPWPDYLQSHYMELLPVDTEILVVCAAGGRSDAASNFLDNQGFLNVYDMLGGMNSWTYDKVGCVDSDSDTINDDLDNCPAIANADQTDADGDEAGDACDTCTDTDNDGYGNPGFPANTCPEDNCPDFASSNQNDADVDCIGDVCDPEPYVYDPSVPDIYPPGGNGCGDACECLADITGTNGTVDLSDLVTMKREFNSPDCATIPCEADCNYDDKVNLADLVIMKSEFNRTDCPACP